MDKGCKVTWCNNKHHAHGFCSKHNHQMQRFGFIKKRTLKDPNEFIIEGNICKILLYDTHSNSIGEAIIDKEDYETVKDYKWGLHQTKFGNYVRSTKDRIYLHRLIMGFPNEVDHKNHNGLDCRKENLRECSSSQNKMNRRAEKGTSKYKGVYWHKQSKKWHTEIMVNGIKHSLGLHKSESQAAKRYNRAALKYFGEFAVLNEV